MSLLYIGFLGLCFLAVVMLLEGLYLSWNAHRGPEARRIERRLQALSAGGNKVEAPIVKKRLLSEVPAIERVLLQVPRVHALDRFLLQSAMDLTVASFLAVAAALALAAWLAVVVAGLPGFVGLIAAVAVVALWVAYVQHRRIQHMRDIEQQLPDALDLMARAMQAGHAFSSALHLVGTDGPQPVAGEFRTTFDEINFGVPFDRALEHLASRVASRDLRYFVVAVVIQRETGGNLAEILTTIAALIRERQRLAGTVRVLSAESRLSAWILTILPFVLAGIITVLNQGFISKLWTDPIGIRMSVTALGMMVIGIVWLWRLVKIRV